MKNKTRRKSHPNSTRTERRKDPMTRLKTELSIQQARLAVLQGMSQLAHQAGSMEELYDSYLQTILKVTRTQAGSILLLDRLSNQLEYVACHGERASRLLHQRLAIGEGIAGWVAQTGQAYFAGDSRRDLRRRKDFARRIGFKTRDVLCAPLKISHRVVGVVEVFNRQDQRPFRHEDLELLEAISAQIALVIENTQLFEMHEAKIQKLRTLEEISRVLNSTLDEKVITHRAMQAATKLMDTEAGSLLLIDPVRKELFFEVALGERGEQVKEVRLKIGEGIAGWVAQTGKPLIVEDVQKDPRFTSKVDRKTSFITRNMICVPIKIKGRTIGVLQAINKKNQGTFSKGDLENFVSLGNQVAIAVDNASLYKELKETFLSTAEALSDTIEAKDTYTGGHTQRVMEYSLAIGRHLGLSADEMENLKLAAILHDIGKIGVDDQVLRKHGKLNEEEKRKMQQHTIIGPRIVQRVRQLHTIIPGIRHHHEMYDGSGYPDAVKGEEIPQMARIIAVADTFDAMTSDRPYRKGRDVESALKEIRQFAGKQFDPKVVQALLSAHEAGEIEKPVYIR
jgi:HD-GYP domain-containing protein (c-di-GMP phosphodiesterase class II)